MTATERLAVLDAIGWSVRELARRLGWSENMTRRWVAGLHRTERPVDAWLRTLAAYHAKHEAPR